jgi:hypothetical protein
MSISNGIPELFRRARIGKLPVRVTETPLTFTLSADEMVILLGNSRVTSLSNVSVRGLVTSQVRLQAAVVSSNLRGNDYA